MSALKLSTVFAGIIFDGTDPDHPLVRSTTGEPFIVRVRALPARHFPDVLKQCTSEPGLIEITTSVADIDPEKKEVKEWIPATPEWVDFLDDESHILLYTTARELNFSRAAKWGERQIAAKKAQAPLLLKADQELMPLIRQMVALLSSSLPPSALPDAPSTRS